MALGPLWIVINPFMNMIIFSVIFGGLAKLPSDGYPYPLFTFSALLPWTYFSTSTSASVRSLTANISLISKVYFNRLIIPLSAVISGLVDLIVNFLILLGLMLYYNVAPTIRIAYLPIFVLFAVFTSLSVGLWTTAIGVKFRDFGFAIAFLLRMWMYATPIAYSATLVPDKWMYLYQLNPMYWVVEGFRWAILGKELYLINYNILIISIVLVFLALIVGSFVFSRAQRTVVDLI